MSDVVLPSPLLILVNAISYVAMYVECMFLSTKIDVPHVVNICL